MNPMRILLVDIVIGKPSIKKFVPLALRKLYNYYSRQGHEVEFITSGEVALKYPDIICFSTIFLFNHKSEVGYIKAYKNKYPKAKILVGGISVSLRPDIFKERLGNIEVHIGLDESFDHVSPNYTNIKSSFSYGFTSRGCINKCAWCVVPKIEGQIRIVDGWENQLGNHKIFSSMDNNLLACGEEHFLKVMQTMKSRKMKIDYNQGLDCVVFAKNQCFIEIMKDHRDNLEMIRFSWDGRRQNKYVEKTIDLLSGMNKKATWYVLYGFNESIEELFERLEYLVSRNQDIKLMRYRDIESGEYKIDRDGWNEKVRCMIGYHYITGIISGKSEDSKLIFSGGIDRFKKIITVFGDMKKTLCPLNAKLTTAHLTRIVSKITS